MTEPVSNPYKLVPVKPTLAMILAATENCSPVGCCSLEPDHAREIWEAMLAASPQGEESPPAMGADHIGDTTNMVAPVEAVAWRIRTSDGEGRFLIEDTGVNENSLTHWKECGWTVQPLYTHPAPIKPSSDTGELRERVARVIGGRKGHPKPWSEDYDLW